MRDNATIIDGKCCGDCSQCQVIGFQDPVPCALRMLMLRQTKMMNKINDVETALASESNTNKSEHVYIIEPDTTEIV